MELFIGQDVANRVNGAGTETGPQTAENYSLTRVSGDPNSTSGETIMVAALGFQQTFTNVGEILVNNTLTGNDTISIANGIQVPVYMTLGSGTNTISTGGGSATVTVSGGGSNQITTGSNSTITVSSGAGGSNQIAAGVMPMLSFRVMATTPSLSAMAVVVPTPRASRLMAPVKISSRYPIARPQ